MKAVKALPDGRVEVSEETGNNPDGTPGGRSWKVEPSQVGVHISTWDTADTASKAQRLSAGDKAALSDRANEYKKQRAS